MERLEITISMNGWLILIVVTVITSGLGILLFLLLRTYPKSLDFEGVVRRDGKKFLWKTITKVQNLTTNHEVCTAADAVAVRGYGIALHFEQGKVRVPFFMIKNPEDLIVFLINQGIFQRQPMLSDKF